MLHTEENKTQNPTIKTLPGHVAAVRITCGKPNCRCAHGDRHTAHYHVTYSNGVRVRKYVRRGELEQMREACQAHRDLQAQLRGGRAEYKELLAQSREILKLLASGIRMESEVF